MDAFIEQLVPLLSPGDIIIDGGNSEYQDTERRTKDLEKKGILFVGSGVSGGEDGARYGPSLMPGGNPKAWPHIKNIFQVFDKTAAVYSTVLQHKFIKHLIVNVLIFQSICAKVSGEPCCDWVGETGAGHFVKMVHNGIEYGDMQLICEAYHILRNGLKLSPEEMSKVFDEWNKGELDSFLIEITRDILKYKDGKGHLLERIRDTAGQKGTGKWTAIAALDYGVPVTLIGESVFARCLSALQSERIEASAILKGPDAIYEGDKKQFLEHLKNALYVSKIISYAQGFMLLREAAKVHNWNLNYGGIALMWRGGCIIRRYVLFMKVLVMFLRMFCADVFTFPSSAFLGNIKAAFDKNPKLSNLLLDDFFAKAMKECQASARVVVSTAVTLGIPTPALSTALAFYDGFRTARLPANLLQAQRDYFGAHTYELLGQEGKFVHTNWTGHGGNVSASTYDV